MSQLRVHALSMSLDGYVAGPDQSLEDPLGVGGERLHEWMFETRTWPPDASASAGGIDGVDDDAFARRGFEGIGATVMGRNMFGPVRGEWAPVAGEEWRGWWGDDPVYHHPVFVLTHHAHDPIEMEGGTTFHFVTDGIESALEQAFAAAGGRRRLRLGGGAATVREYLRARPGRRAARRDRAGAARRRRAAVRRRPRRHRRRLRVRRSPGEGDVTCACTPRLVRVEPQAS